MAAKYRGRAMLALIFISRQAWTCQFVGTCEVADKIWLVSFLDFDLGFFHEAAARVEPGANPFASKALTMCPV
jgi:hypothetical protein